MESELAQSNRAKAAAPAVGWIGAGKMGAPMARHLLAAGADLVVTDPNAESRNAMAAAGAQVAALPRSKAATWSLRPCPMTPPCALSSLAARISPVWPP